MLASFLFLSAPLHAQADDQPTEESGEAQADTRSAEERRTDALLQSAEILRKDGRIVEAIEAYSRAYEISQDHQLLLLIAELSEQREDYAAAEKSLERYRSQLPKEEQPAVDKRLQELAERQQARLAKEKQQQQQEQKPEETLQQYSSAKPSQWIDRSLMGLGAASALTGTLYGLETMNIRKEMRSEYCKYNSRGETVCAFEGSPLLEKEKTLSLVADLSWGLSAMSFGYSIWRSRQLGAHLVPTPTGFLVQGRY